MVDGGLDKRFNIRLLSPLSLCHYVNTILIMQLQQSRRLLSRQSSFLRFFTNAQRLLLIASCLLSSVYSFAQLPGNGYYRVLNSTTSRYILVTSDKGKVNYEQTDVDLGSLWTIKNFNKVISAPGSILYLEKDANGKYSYSIKSQGTDTYSISGGHYLNITDNGNGTYKASGSDGSVTMYLVDEPGTDPEGVVLTGKKNGSTSNWYILPVTTADNACFGFTPDVTVGNQRFAAFYASFPFSFVSPGMKAYYIRKVDQGMAVLAEWTNSVIPASMPVLISCSSASPTSNKVDLNVSTNIAGVSQNYNLLRGVYFDNTNKLLGHYDRYNPKTMRVLGITSKGQLGFVQHRDTIIPANKAYLQVPVGTPDELRIVTDDEYFAEVNKPVTVTANSYTITYGSFLPRFAYATEGADLQGVPQLTCAATKGSPVGTYPIEVARGSVTNSNLTLVNGTLTITPAFLNIAVEDCSREQGQDNPDFTFAYRGFVNGDDASTLVSLPVATTTATADSPVGTYPVTPAGAESPNYNITYTPGTLTVTVPAKVGTVDSSVSSLPAVVNDLQGRRVRSASLKKGVYVVRGRKVLIP